MPRVFAFGEKEPVPDEVQLPLPVDDVPDKATFALFAHTVRSVPALTVGTGVIVIRTLSVTAKQFPFPVEVSVSVTDPALISAADGV